MLCVVRFQELVVNMSRIIRHCNHSSGFGRTVGSHEFCLHVFFTNIPESLALRNNVHSSLSFVTASQAGVYHIAYIICILVRSHFGSSTITGAEYTRSRGSHQLRRACWCSPCCFCSAKETVRDNRVLVSCSSAFGRAVCAREGDSACSRLRAHGSDESESSA